MEHKLTRIKKAYDLSKNIRLAEYFFYFC